MNNVGLILTFIYRCESEMNKALKKYNQENNLPKDQKIFIVIGHYDDVRVEMVRRGWVEH